LLFGVVNPSGHLPLTYPESADQLPRPLLDGDPARPEMQFAVNYHEGAAVGYKWYDLKRITPLFPFGHGLSYTEFVHSDLAASQALGRVQVSFTVANGGSVKGKAVPQLYVAPLGAQWEAPKRLAGWDKIELQPGESRRVRISVDPRLFGMLDAGAKTWRVARGQYRLILAKDALDTSGPSVTIDLPGATLDLQGRPTGWPRHGR
jgi:beta-glucosidase